MIEKSLLLFLCFHSSKAFAAVNRSVIAGLERNFCFLATVCTNSCKEFSCSLACVLSCVTASFASLRFILKSACFVEFLFTGGENKFLAAVLTYQCFVLIHFFPSLWINNRISRMRLRTSKTLKSVRAYKSGKYSRV